MRNVLFILLSFLTFSGAFAQDIEGSSDHPLLPRYEGSEIVRYETLAYEEYELWGVTPDEQPGIAFTIEGQLTRITYMAPPERSVLEVFRNYESALSSAGFSPIHTCTGQDCGRIHRHIESGPLGVILWGDRSHRYIAAHLSREEGDVYVSLYVTRNNSGGPARGRAMVQLDVIEIAPMEDRMVVVEAGKMQQDLAAAGRVVIYGIHFDFDSDRVREDSRPQLDEIARLLAENPLLNVLIVGHTDSKGDFDYNLDLSERRAVNVVRILSDEYGIDRKRMTPAGVGMSAPVASNRSEEGRSLNRRVEIVER